METQDDLLERDDLISWFSTAAKSGGHLIGTEQEKFGVAVWDVERDVPMEMPRPATWAEHVSPLLDAFVRDFGWQPGPPDGLHGEVVSLTRDGANITLEPGGQFELSGAPLANVHLTCAEFTTHYNELHAAASKLGLAYLAAGFQPFATREEIDWMPKGRYRVMRSYLPTKGKRALDMMLRTSTVQANFDYAGEAECGERFKMMLAVSPVVTAIFANSPYREGQSTGMMSYRSDVWDEVDPDRCGTPRFLLEEPFSFERYVDYALDVPMFFVKRGKNYHPYHETFRTFVNQGFRTDDGVLHRATRSDWATHLSTLFPEVRLKPFIEVRCPDSVGSAYVCALPALCKGILYDEAATRAVWELTGTLAHDEWTELLRIARVHGPAHPTVRSLALRVIEIARDGLDRQDVRDSKGRTESRFLDNVQSAVAAGRCPASDVLEKLGPNPGRDAAARRAYVKAFHFAGRGGEGDSLE